MTNNTFDPYKILRGKTAWLTGARRIGGHVAQALAERGVNLVVSYRSSQTETQKIIREVEKFGVKTLGVQMDVGDRESVAAAVAHATKKFPKLDILINLASIFTATPFAKITAQDWENNFHAHVLGTFWPIQLITPHMPRGGHIINIADRTVLGKIYTGYVPYVVTKAAVAALTRAMAVELAPQGIFVNAIAPGPILKPNYLPEKEWQALRDSSPLKYPMTDDEALNQFAALVLYLSIITAATGYIYPLDQGQNL